MTPSIHYRKSKPSNMPPFGTLPGEDYIRKVLDYNPRNGFLSWAKRTPEMCAPVVDAKGNAWSSDEVANWFNVKFAGRRAGSKAGTFAKGTGRVAYSSIKLNGVCIPTSHACWFMETGRWPNGRIKFKDGNPANLRFENLIESALDSDRFNNIHFAPARRRAEAIPVRQRSAYDHDAPDHDT